MVFGQGDWTIGKGSGEMSDQPATVKQDLVRVLRVIEYTGERKAVESIVAKSLHGEKRFDQFLNGKNFGLIIRAATIGTYPEILEVEVKPSG